MTQPAMNPGVLRRDAIRLATKPAMIDCSAHADGQAPRTLAVVPLLDGERVAGFEVRCGCGAFAFVECVYGKEAPP
jgi:hypothetical protein